MRVGVGVEGVLGVVGVEGSCCALVRTYSRTLFQFFEVRLPALTMVRLRLLDREVGGKVIEAAESTRVGKMVGLVNVVGEEEGLEENSSKGAKAGLSWNVTVVGTRLLL